MSGWVLSAYQQIVVDSQPCLRKTSRTRSATASKLPGQCVTLARNAWNNSQSFGTSLEQNPWFLGSFSVPSRSKGNRIISIYGAGDGNRTHVRSLGSLRYNSKHAGLAAFLQFSKRLNWKIMENGK